MLFKQLGAGGQDRAITSNENFNCPDGKTSKQEFECTGVKPNTDTKIWGKVRIRIQKELYFLAIFSLKLKRHMINLIFDIINRHI